VIPTADHEHCHTLLNELKVSIGPDPGDPNGGKLLYLGKEKVTQEG
jgi:hypothetical protein